MLVVDLSREQARGPLWNDHIQSLADGLEHLASQ
jgi:hypothetical protein